MCVCMPLTFKNRSATLKRPSEIKFSKFKEQKQKVYLEEVLKKCTLG